MATTTYTQTASENEWGTTAAYTASGETAVNIVNPGLLDAFIWHQLASTIPTVRPRNAIRLPPGDRYPITLADGENVFIAASRDAVVNILE